MARSPRAQHDGHSPKERVRAEGQGTLQARVPKDFLPSIS